MPPHLRYQDGDGATRTLALEAKEIVIGRDPDCDLVVSRRFVSRKHARCIPLGTGWAIVDLGSSHGTFVNRLRVQQKQLEPDDQIAIGDGAEVITFVDPARTRTSPIPAPAMSDTFDPEATEILAEHGVGDGDLVKTMRGAHGVDVLALTMRQQSVARLVQPGTQAALTPSAPTPGGDSMRMDAAVAGHLLALVRISDGLRRAPDIDAVCRTAVEMALTVTGATRAVLALRDPATNQFVDRAQRHVGNPEHTPADSIRISRTFVDMMVSKRVALLARDTGLDSTLARAESVMSSGIRSILCAPLWNDEEITGYLYMDTTGGTRRFRREDLDLVSAIGHQAAAEIALRSAEARRSHLSSFLGGDVVRHIEEQARTGQNPMDSASERDVTILFADIKGFTAISEKLQPAAVKKLLDGYLDKMTEIIIERHGGTLSQFMGDGIMALWGAPFGEGREVDARRAVATAVDMRDTVNALRETDPQYRDLHIRIGINTGRVIAGMLGSQRRLEYTVIGDAVNVASRLESTGEAGKIQIGEGTWEAVRDAFECESAGARVVKNRAAPVKSWWVTGARA